MNRCASAIASFTPVLVLLAVLAVVPVDAVDTGKTSPPKKPTLDCGDASNDICFECCPNFECADPGSKVACCYDDCDIIFHEPPHQPSPDLHLVLSAGGAQLTFDRKLLVGGNSDQRHFDITVQQIFDPTIGRRSFKVTAQVTGGDAAVGSLLYAVAFLGIGEDALDALHAQGYDVVIVGASAETCQSRLSDAMCTALANQLSQGISASLPIGASSERAPFLQGVQALGFPPCGLDLD